MAVATPPTFYQLARPWASETQPLDAITSDNLRDMIAPRKKTILPRSNSSSSLSSTSSASSAATTVMSPSSAGGSVTSTPPLFGTSDQQNWSTPTSKVRQQSRGSWSTLSKSEELPRPAGARGGTPLIGQGPMMAIQNGTGVPSSQHQPQLQHPQQHQQSSQLQQQQGQQLQLQQPQQQQQLLRPNGEVTTPAPNVPALLVLLSMNGTFERKTITVPFGPEVLKIGRQTNPKTAPTASNGYFDSKVLSRQHAELYADRLTGKVFIRDVKSSNGTFVNGHRLSPENRESEPRELLTGDQLELGIDIVHEDQKSIIHHKVSAKIEHAGWPAPSNSVLDMSYGDLDPANGGMMLSNGGPGPFRGRAGSNASSAMHSRNGGAAGAAPGQQPPVLGPGVQRQLWMTQVTTEHIVKKLQDELRGSRLMHQDLMRAAQVVNVLGSRKSELRQMDGSDGMDPAAAAPTPAHVSATAAASPATNGHSLPFRDNAKNRFSGPPAPPPSQPLPEKPDVTGFKRANTEKAKLANGISSPLPDSNSTATGQVAALTEALLASKKDHDSQLAKVRELEDMLLKERAARELAEAMAERFQHSAQQSTLQQHDHKPKQPDVDAAALNVDESSPESQPESDTPSAAALVFTLQNRVEAMSAEFCTLKAELDLWRSRCENAEAEKDRTARKLTEMIKRVEEADEARRLAEERKSLSRSRRRGRSTDEKPAVVDEASSETAVPDGTDRAEKAAGDDATATGGSVVGPSSLLAAKSTTSLAAIPPVSLLTATATASCSGTSLLRHGTQQHHHHHRHLHQNTQNHVLVASIPYLAMFGVVAVGVSLMAYFNDGWAPSSAKPVR